MAQVFKNNSSGTLSSAITALAANIVLTPNQGNLFPAITGGDYFLVTLIGTDAQGAESAWEILKCTAKVADTLTVVRGQEGTTAMAWPAGTKVELRITAGTLNSFTDTTEVAAAMTTHTSATDPHAQYLLKEGGTASGLTLDNGYTETVYDLTGTDIAAANGSVQTKTLVANTTLTDSLVSGQSVILGINDGTTYTVTWPTITWATTPAAAPTLPTSGYLWVVLWKVGTTLYGKY